MLEAGDKNKIKNCSNKSVKNVFHGKLIPNITSLLFTLANSSLWSSWVIPKTFNKNTSLQSGLTKGVTG